MTSFHVNYSKGQIKIQQMAFVLVAIFIFFVLIGLFFVYIQLSSINGSAEDLRSKAALEKARNIVNTPEFAWGIEDCSSCLDLDKILILKDRVSYKGFWDLSLLKIKRVYPEGEGECTKQNYPDCGEITIIDSENVPASRSAFVSLCRYDLNGDYFKCELGKVIVAGEAIL